MKKACALANPDYGLINIDIAITFYIFYLERMFYYEMALEQQLANVEVKLKELQARKKSILAQIAEIERGKETESLKELYFTLQAKGITPEQYGEVLEKISKR